jgi:hypothetical protein
MLHPNLLVTVNGVFCVIKNLPKAISNIICEALADKQRLATMGEKGQQFVLENYKWEKTVDTMINLMKKYE